MIKKFRDTSGMQDMFVQQAIEEKTALFEAAREKIQKEIDALENFSEKHDSGLSSVEDRNDLQYLKAELRHLEEKYYEDVAKLKTNQK